MSQNDSDDFDEGFFHSLQDDTANCARKGLDSDLLEDNYKIIELDQVHQLMLDDIERIKAIVDLPTTQIRLLLKHFKWDVQRLLEKLCDDSQEKLFAEAGISTTKTKRYNTRSWTKKTRLDDNTCGICFGDLTGQETFSLACQHQFCQSCWVNYLITKIMDLGQSDAIKCPQTECDEIIDDQQVFFLVADPEVRRRYQRLITNSFVETNRLLRWCPNPECLRVYKVNSTNANVKCRCGAEICFGCGNPVHSPVECQLLKAWIIKSSEVTRGSHDGQTIVWLVRNTKECPKCHANIEKNGGCNHMSCNTCKYEFCWVCLSNWKNHNQNFYSCTRYKDDQSLKKNKSANRLALERYHFYWERYNDHKESLKFEKQLHEKIETIMANLMEAYHVSYVEVQFLQSAVDSLCRARQTLMNTYVFAFYCKPSSQLQIFEENQLDLQQVVEKLSEYLERRVTEEDLSTMKPTIINLSKYCENRRRVLVEHIQEGTDNGWWSYELDL